MLEIYFESSRGGMPQIWRAERASAGVTWSPPTPVVELDGQMANTPEISRDGLTLYFSSTSGSPVPAAYVTTRPDRASPWGPPVHVSGLVIVEGISGVVPFFDDRAVIYATTAPGGPGNQDLWLALRTGSGCATFGMNAPLPGLANTVDAEFNPWVRNDGLAVAFASPRSSGTGSSDLWISTRASTASDFTASIEQATLSSPGVDDDPWLDDAMGVIYFMSTRNGTAQIYSASR